MLTKEEIDKVINEECAVRVKTELIFESKVLALALRWSRANNFTYERDGEIGDMLIAYISNVPGVDFDIEDTDEDIEE